MQLPVPPGGLGPVDPNADDIHGRWGNRDSIGSHNSQSDRDPNSDTNTDTHANTHPDCNDGSRSALHHESALASGGGQCPLFTGDVGRQRRHAAI
jgi:hypothetical protein